MEGVRHGVDPRIEGRIRSAIPATLICGKIILSQFLSLITWQSCCAFHAMKASRSLPSRSRQRLQASG